MRYISIIIITLLSGCNQLPEKITIQGDFYNYCNINQPTNPPVAQQNQYITLAQTYLPTVLYYVKLIFLIITITIILWFVIPIIFPKTKPTIDKITGFIGRFFAWLCPIIGGLVEFIKSIMGKKAVLRQQNQFIEKIKQDEVLNEQSKTYIISLLENNQKEIKKLL